MRKAKTAATRKPRTPRFRRNGRRDFVSSPTDMKVGDIYAFGAGDEGLKVQDGPCIIRVSMRYAGPSPIIARMTPRGVAREPVEDVLGSFDVHLRSAPTLETVLGVAKWVTGKLLQRNERTGAEAFPELLVRRPNDKFYGIPVFEVQHGT